MSTHGKKLKRPVTFQKRLIKPALLTFAVLSLGYASVYFSQKYEYEITEFVAKGINAELDKILVDGVENLDNSQLLEQIGLKKGDSLVGFNAGNVRENIQTLDWVKEAVVERKLPSTIKISIYEYTPIARLDLGEEGLFVVDSEGHQITEIGTDDFKNLPLLKGDEAANNAAELFGILMEKGIKLGEQVVEARFIGERRWDIGFASGVWVQLPENNAEHALDVLKKLDARKNVLAMEGGVVDLRLEDRVVLRLSAQKKIKERIL